VLRATSLEEAEAAFGEARALTDHFVFLEMVVSPKDAAPCEGSAGARPAAAIRALACAAANGATRGRGGCFARAAPALAHGLASQLVQPQAVDDCVTSAAGCQFGLESARLMPMQPPAQPNPSPTNPFNAALRRSRGRHAARVRGRLLLALPPLQGECHSPQRVCVCVGGGGQVAAHARTRGVRARAASPHP
jgi:hypothetical protein